MKKGKIYTCNGCYAFEDSVRLSPLGSPAASYSSEAFCSVGIEIICEDHNYKPKKGVCKKPKTITRLCEVKQEFFQSLNILK